MAERRLNPFLRNSLMRLNRAKARVNPSFGGYDEEFVNAVEDDLQCAICRLALKSPVQTTCGHRFCRDCLDEHFKSKKSYGDRFPCPIDRSILIRNEDVFPDKATERKILSFYVHCPSKECQWNGELRSKDAHLESCPLKVVSCTNANCNEAMTRNNLQAHVTTTCPWRILQCIHCSVSHPACKTEAHELNCHRKPINCPKNCGAVVPREELSVHDQKDCPLTITSCPYAEMGCTTEVQRGKMEIHLQASVKPHLDLACAKLNTTQDQLKMSQQATNNLTEKVFALENQWTLFQETLELSRLADGERVDALTRKLDTFQCQYEERFRELEIGVKTVKETVKDDSNRLGVLEKKGIRPLSRPSNTLRLNQSLCETSNDNVNGNPYLPARYSPRRASEIYSYSSLVNGTSADKADATDLPIYTPLEIGVKTIKKTVEDDSNRLGVLEKQGTRSLSRPSYTRLNQSLCETSNDNVNGTSYLPAMYCSRRGRPTRYTSRFQTY